MCSMVSVEKQFSVSKAVITDKQRSSCLGCMGETLRRRNVPRSKKTLMRVLNGELIVHLINCLLAYSVIKPSFSYFYLSPGKL